MTHRFFVPSHQISGPRVTIMGSDAKQIKNVLKLKEGDMLEVLDGSSKVFAVKINSVKSDEVLCFVTSSRSMKTEPAVKITLIQSIAREAKMDMVIQKCTELGVTKIVPVVSERTIIKLDQEKKDKRLSRWQRIAKEAAEQSSRAVVPGIEEIKDFAEALGQEKGTDLKLIPWEMEEKTSIKTVLKENKKVKSLSLAIGPEGGFSSKEVKEAKAAGFIPVSLGKRILRTETAGIAVLSMINYEFEM
jgi:16S rRNA (uracil1498-N3)-methyltransferase